MPREIETRQIGTTPEELRRAILDLAAEYDAHNHDGTSSRSFETLRAHVASLEALSIRKTNYGSTANGLWMGIVNNVMKLVLGNADSYLQWDGSNLTFTGKTRQTMKLGTIFETSARFSQSTSGGTITFGTFGIQLDTTATANRYARLEIPMNSAGAIGNTRIFEETAFSAIINVAERGGSGAGHEGIAFVGLMKDGGTADGTTLALARDQYGFKIVKGSSAVALYATSGNSDSGLEEATLLDNITEDDGIFVAAACTPTAVTFIAIINNDVFTATHATVIPKQSTSEANCGFIFANNKNTNSQLIWEVSSYTFEKFSGGTY